MSAGVARYSEYKDSGVAWLGEVPEHWQIRPLWTMFRRIKRIGFETEILLSVYREFGVIPKESRDDNFNKPSDDLGAYQLVDIGDLTINKMKAWQGSVGISEYRGIVSPAYFVYEALHNEVPRYQHYLFRTAQYTVRYLSLSKGIRVNQWDLDPQYHSRMPVLVPPVSEQTAIANFLDRETSKIDALVEEQEKLIALLKEKRQVVISHAVTKGLDPSVPMKDSGIEWLGEVPGHWQVAQLGKITSERCDGPFGSGLKSEHYRPDGVRVVRLQNIGWATFKNEDAAFISHEHWRQVLGSGHEVLPNDVLIAGLGDDNNPLGRACVAPNNLGDALVKADCYRFRLEEDRSIPTFVALSLSASAREECGYLATGATRARLNLGLAAARVIALPPLDEQAQIVVALDHATTRIDKLIQCANLSIYLLKERRSALISAAVTGKIDVRGLVAEEVTA